MKAAPDLLRAPRGPAAGSVLAKLQMVHGFATDPVGFVARRFERYGDVYFVPGKPHGLFVLRHPDQIYQVLVERAASFSKEHGALERMKQVLGTGLLTADGEAWRRHRRMIQPAFQHARLVAYSEVMREEAEARVARWRDGQVVDMGSEMMSLTLAVVCRTLFSHDAGGQTSDVSHAMGLLQDSITRPDLLPSWLPSPARSRLNRATALLDHIIIELIRGRKRQRDARGGETRSDDLLDRLLDARDEDGAELGEKEIRDELVTLFLAGHETTAQALTWSFYLLSQHAEADARLGAELERELGARGPGHADLERLPYTEQVVDEAMRIYPPVYVVARRAVEDVEIGAYRVPAGSELALWILLCHRDSRWFEAPLEFRPERWTHEMRAALPRAAYLPFGAGPRTCIGKSFAHIEARILLATLARKFRAELVPGPRIGMKPRVTLVPSRSVRMLLRQR